MKIKCDGSYDDICLYCEVILDVQQYFRVRCNKSKNIHKQKFYLNQFKLRLLHYLAYTVKCSFHVGELFFLIGSVLRGFCPSTLNSTYESGFELKKLPEPCSFALDTIKYEY